MVKDGPLKEWGEGPESGNGQKIQRQEMSVERPSDSSRDESNREIWDEPLACLVSSSHTATPRKGRFTL